MIPGNDANIEIFGMLMRSVAKSLYCCLQNHSLWSIVQRRRWFWPFLGFGRFLTSQPVEVGCNKLLTRLVAFSLMIDAGQSGVRDRSTFPSLLSDLF